MAHMPVGYLMLSVSKGKDYGTSVKHVNSNEVDLSTTLSLPVHLTGQVVDAETSLPISAFKVKSGHVVGELDKTSWDDYQLIADRPNAYGWFDFIQQPGPVELASGAAEVEPGLVAQSGSQLPGAQANATGGQHFQQMGFI